MHVYRVGGNRGRGDCGYDMGGVVMGRRSKAAQKRRREKKEAKGA